MAIALANISESGEAPEARVKDAKSLFKIYEEVAKADSNAAFNRAQVRLLREGEPPFDQKKREEAGVGWMSNFNSGTAAADLEQAQTGYVGLANAVPTLIEVRTRYGDVAKRKNWCTIIADQFDWLMKSRWPSFDKNKQKTTLGFISNGLSVVYWPHDVDWRYEVGQLGQFLFPVDADVDVSKLEIAFQVESFAPSKLFKQLKQQEKIKANGDSVDINREAMISAIRDASSDSGSSGWGMSELEAAFDGNSLGQDYGFSQQVRVVHAYVKEFSEKVSHYMIRADGKGEDFLSVRREAFPCMSKFMVFYSDGVGEGKLADLRGFLQKGFESYIAADEVLNGMRDSAMLSLKPLMKGNNTAVGTEMSAETTISAFVIPPPGVTFEEMPIPAGNAQLAMAFRAEMQRLGANNTGGYQSHAISPEGGERTLGEVQLQAQNNARISDAKYGNYYQSEAQVNENTFRRLINRNYTSGDPGYAERMEFFERCTSRGVPIEAIWEVDEVITIRAVGYGSPASRQAAFGLLERKRPYLSPVGQNNLDRDEIAMAVGYDNVDRYELASQAKTTPIDVQFADLEHGMFILGVPFPVRPDQDHFLHAVEHDAFLNGTLKVIYDGPPPAPHGQIDAVQAVKQLSVALDHQAQHLKLITDPSKKDAVKDLQKSFGQVVKAFQGLGQQAQAQQQAALPAPQAPPAPDPALIKAQADIDRENALAAAEIAREHDKNQAHIATSAVKATAEAHLKAFRAGAQDAPTQFPPVAAVIDPTVPQIPPAAPQIITP